MKKILMAVFAILMTAAWVAPAMADTTFYGTYRVRLFSTNNASDYNSSGDTKTYSGVGSNVTTTAAANPTDNNSWVDQRFRLGVESKASDNLRGFVQLEIGDTNGPNRSHVWGSGAAGNDWGTANNENNRVNVRQAYLSFSAGPVRVKAGRQVFGDAPDGGQSFRVADDGVYYGLIDGGLILVSQIDAFILTTKAVDPMTLYFGYAKLTEASYSATTSTSVPSTTTDSSDRDNTLYILQATAAPSDTLKAGAYFLYDRDRTTIVQPSATKSTNSTGQNSPWWLGAGVEAKLNPINLKVHGAYKGGKQDKGCQPGSCGIAATGSAADRKYSAYAIDGDVSMNLGQATVGVAAGLGSGDKSTQDEKSQNFTGVVGSYGNQLGVRPAIFFDNGEVSNGGASLATVSSNSIDRTTLGNITFAQLYGSFKATDDLTLSGLYAGFWHSQNKQTTGAATSTEWESKLGTEFDLTAVYKLYPQLAIVGQLAWFMPGDGIKSSKNQAGNWSGNAADDAVSEYFAKIQYDF